MTDLVPAILGLPAGWTVRLPTSDDVPQVVRLLQRHREVAGGPPRVDAEALESELVGRGSWTRRQFVLRDPQGEVVGWAGVHDRAAGRTDVDLVLDPRAPDDDAVASAVLRWIAQVAGQVAGERGLRATRLDALAYATDERQQRWLGGAGYELARTWRHMSRPVEPAEADGHAITVRPGVRVRTVHTHPDGMPVAEDLRTVHLLLEESFADHFNSYRESLAEFLARLGEGPGHTWDHWWIAEIEEGDDWLPGGALVGTVLPENADGFEGTYVEYLGVHRRARGRGVAKALLGTVIADAARRGRDRVGLEVDAQSPTHADALYTSLGWRTGFEMQSWQTQVGAEPAP